LFVKFSHFKLLFNKMRSSAQLIFLLLATFSVLLQGQALTPEETTPKSSSASSCDQSVQTSGCPPSDLVAGSSQDDGLKASRPAAFPDLEQGSKNLTKDVRGWCPEKSAAQVQTRGNRTCAESAKGCGKKKKDEKHSKKRRQVAFYLTVYYLAALVGASLMAFYCICRVRGNATFHPYHQPV